jgi:DNA-binding Lrp family transcriptional regulator
LRVTSDVFLCISEAELELVRVILELFVEVGELGNLATELSELPEVVDLYEVTGEPDMVAIIEVDSLSAFRDLLVHKILQIKGVRSTTSAVVLRTNKEPARTLQAC